MVQSVKRPTLHFGSGHDPRVSMQPAMVLSLPLPLSPSHALSLSLREREGGRKEGRKRKKIARTLNKVNRNAIRSLVGLSLCMVPFYFLDKKLDS